MSYALLNDLTIVIPTYRSRYLTATVASALRAPGASILIAEDCGRDETLPLARELEKKHPDRIRVTSNETNLGMTRNWQQAMGSVKTTYGLYLSDDDVVSATYLPSAVEFLRQHLEVAMIAGEQADVVEDFVLNGDVPYDVPVALEDFKIMRGLETAKFALIWAPYAAASSTIFRMDAWRSIGGFNIQLGWCPDRDMWFRMGRKYDVAFCRKLAVHYRVLDTSVTATHRRGDKFCYELSTMLRNARKEWPESELTPYFRSNFRITAKAFLGSSVRAAKAGRVGEVLPRAVCSVKDALAMIK